MKSDNVKKKDIQSVPVTSEPKKSSNPAKLVQTPKLPTKLAFCQNQDSKNKPVGKKNNHNPQN